MRMSVLKRILVLLLVCNVLVIVVSTRKGIGDTSNAILPFIEQEWRQGEEEEQPYEKDCEMQLPKECKKQPCFIFKDFDPHSMIPKTTTWNKKIFEQGQGFECSQYRENDMGGLLFELLDDFWDKNKKEKSQCYYSPEKCSWTGLFNFIENGGIDGEYQLIFYSSLLETKQRRYSNAIASFPIWTDHLITVGWRTESENSDWSMMFRPLDHLSWTFLMLLNLIFAICGLFLYYANPIHVLPYQKVSNHLYHRQVENSHGHQHRWTHLFDVLSAMFGTFLGHTGDVGQSNMTISHEQISPTSNSSNHLPETTEGETLRLASSFVEQKAIYGLGKVLFAMTFASHMYFFLVFYEAALTNFLFQPQQFELKEPVTKMKDVSLNDLIVHDASALTDIFEELQKNNTNWKDRKHKPWSYCVNYKECFEALKEGRKKYTIVEATVARFLIKNGTNCNTLGIFSPSKPLFSFNSVFYYSPAISPEFRTKLDNVLKLARLNGKLQRTKKKLVDSASCDLQREDISFAVVIVLMAFICVIVILIVIAQLVLIFLRCRDRSRGQDSSESDANGSHCFALPHFFRGRTS